MVYLRWNMPDDLEGVGDVAGPQVRDVLIAHELNGGIPTDK
jgi:hypothetical protein